MKNKNVIFCLLILCIIVFFIGLHGGSDYYFRDFCVHKTLNMFYNNGHPKFFEKPSLVSDIEAVVYLIYYFILKHLHIVNNLDEFTKYFSLNYIPTKNGAISFMLPGLIINNIFSALGVCFTFLTTYILTNKKIFPSFISAFVLATSYCWMNFSHHITVDIPLSSLCIMTIFYSLYFIQNKDEYSNKDILIIGILSGLCAAAKYNGAIILIVPILILLYTESSIKKMFKNLYILFMSFTITFFICNPFILFDFYTFYSDFYYQYNHAFSEGHYATDDKSSLTFHLFHSFPNAIGLIPYLLSLVGIVLFLNDNKVEKKIKLTLFSFPLIFFLFMILSYLVFLRYILPIVPILAVFNGLLINYMIEDLKSGKLPKIILTICIMIILVPNCINAIHFYKLMGTTDTRISIKNIIKSLNLDNQKKVIYTDIFSNPYYVEDFLNEYPDLKNNIKSYLYEANNYSILLFANKESDIFSYYDIIIFDSSYDRDIQIRKYILNAHTDPQFFMYSPHQGKKKYILMPKKEFYIVQINPYNTDKELVPFDILKTDWKYRKYRGPFVEIYFKDKNLQKEFFNKCSEYSLPCKKLNFKNGYYFQNLNFVNKIEDIKDEKYLFE